MILGTCIHIIGRDVQDLVCICRIEGAVNENKRANRIDRKIAATVGCGELKDAEP